MSFRASIMRRSHSFRSWQRRYERPGRASVGRGNETRDQCGGNLLLKKEVLVSPGTPFRRPNLPCALGRFSLPVAQTFPLAEIAQAHRVSEDGHVRGKLVLLVG
jgi:hypothetical protein